MKIELELHVPDAKGEILDLKEHFQEKNFSEFKVTEKFEPAKVGTMGGGELQSILELILSPAVSIAIATGVFKVIKDYMNLREHKITKQTEERKVVLSKTSKKGGVEKLEMSIFSDEEREQLINFFINND